MPRKKSHSSKPDVLDEQVRDCGGLVKANEMLLEVTAGDITEHCQRLVEIIFVVGQECFDTQQADRYRRMLWNGVQKGKAIPVQAKAAWLHLADQWETALFKTYVRAALITGVAAGLRGFGARTFQHDDHGRRAMSDNVVSFTGKKRPGR